MKALPTPNRDRVTVTIAITVGNQTMVVKDTQPLHLGGDSRRHRRYVQDQLLKQFGQLAPVLALRFGKR